MTFVVVAGGSIQRSNRMTLKLGWRISAQSQEVPLQHADQRQGHPHETHSAPMCPLRPLPIFIAWALNSVSLYERVRSRRRGLGVGRRSGPGRAWKRREDRTLFLCFRIDCQIFRGFHV